MGLKTSFYSWLGDYYTTHTKQHYWVPSPNQSNALTPHHYPHPPIDPLQDKKKKCGHKKGERAATPTRTIQSKIPSPPFRYPNPPINPAILSVQQPTTNSTRKRQTKPQPTHLIRPLTQPSNPYDKNGENTSQMAARTDAHPPTILGPPIQRISIHAVTVNITFTSQQ